MVEPSCRSGSMFYHWLVSIVFISSLEHWFNFENVSRILDCGVQHHMPWFPNYVVMDICREFQIALK